MRVGFKAETTKVNKSKNGLVKTFQCLYCHKYFIGGNSKINRHLRTHTGVICDKRFTRNCSLKYHVMMHINERLYKCKICEISFSTKSNLYRHRENHERSKKLNNQILKIQNKENFEATMDLVEIICKKDIFLESLEITEKLYNETEIQEAMDFYFNIDNNLY